MKNSNLNPALIVSALAFITLQSHAETSFPRPAFMPSTPAATKAISSYTAAEVVGVVTTDSSQIPVDHAYSEAKYKAGLKTTWPGAKDKLQINAMVQVILDAPVAAPQREIDASFENVRYVIQEVMEVSDTDKADAFVRIVEAQTDPLKKKRATGFARTMFYELLDPRLLRYSKDALDDATEYPHPIIVAPEGKPTHMTSVRREAKRDILIVLNGILKLSIDETPYKTSDEASSCAALKAWLTANWGYIEEKCIQLRTSPERDRPRFNIHPWDARW